MEKPNIGLLVTFVCGFYLLITQPKKGFMKKQNYKIKDYESIMAVFLFLN